MAIPAIYTWPVQDLKAIVDNVQLGAGVRSFTFNGHLATSPSSAITLTGISRVLSLKSTANLSAINFTFAGVSGAGGSEVISETIAGPNNNTVYTTNSFNIVTAIGVNADMTGAVDIGTGLTGFTNWFYFDPQTTGAYLSVQAVRTTTMNYTFESTSDNVLSLTNANINKFNTIADMVSATTTLYKTLVDSPILFCRMKINSSDATGALVTTIIQQGLS